MLGVIRYKRFLLILVFFCLFCLLFLFYSENYRLLITQRFFVQKDESRKTKTILVTWNHLHKRHPNFTTDATSACSKCLFSNDMYDLDISDAVIFHSSSNFKRDPTKVSSKQIWIWYFYEAPTSSLKPKHEAYADRFNWTMTYRHDADIYLPHGHFLPKVKQSNLRPDEEWAYRAYEITLASGVYNKSVMPVPLIEELSNRTMAAWVTSNCKTRSKRQLIASELAKYVQVDIYGSCGKLKCSRNYYTAAINGEPDCRREIGSRYKFYLSFENSLCEDYVTEKFFLPFFTQMVPIVYGGANYSRYAPKNSYINIMDFNSVESLAEYLIHLDKNPTEYLKYFEWRRDYWIQSYGHVSFAHALCQICDRLWDLEKNSDVMSTTYSDITSWWTLRSDYDTSGKPACINPPTKYLPSNTAVISSTRKSVSSTETSGGA